MSVRPVVYDSASPFAEDVDQSNGNVGFEVMPAKRIAEAVALGRLG
jgi:hypothetical protein